MALDKQALIDGLNSDLAGEYAAIIQYTHYAATVTGPFRESLRTMFMAEVPDEQRHAQYLADQIAFLGGTPTTSPAAGPRGRDAQGDAPADPGGRGAGGPGLQRTHQAGRGVRRHRPQGGAGEPGLRRDQSQAGGVGVPIATEKKTRLANLTEAGCVERR